MPAMTPEIVRARPEARQPKPLRPVAPLVDFLGYSRPLHVGLVRIDGVTYAMFGIRDAGRVIGVKLVKETVEPDGTHAMHDVHFNACGWACDCQDATYRPGRPGGCKHLHA